MSSNAVILLKKETTIDKIRKYYVKGEDSVTLTENKENIHVYLSKARTFMINYHSKQQAVNVLINDEASRAQSYRYVNDSLFIFGDILKNQKEAKHHLIEEDLPITCNFSK